MEGGTWIREIHPKPAEDEERDVRLDLPKGTIKLLISLAILEFREGDEV
jgi:hypothetical protein